MASEPAHYELSPSSAKRWLNCPGSIKMSRGKTDETSAAAEEGTLIHELAERVLNQTITPSEMAKFTDYQAEMATGFADYCLKIMEQ